VNTITPLGRRVLSRYRGAGLATRLFLNARWRWTPYERVAAALPTCGTILDLGSGHGLLSLALGLSEPGRTVRGVDHDPTRTALARRAAGDVANVAFDAGSLLDGVTAADGIVVLDAIHYLSFDEQELFLARCRAALRPGGVLLIRDVDAAAGSRSVVNRMYERVMTGLRITRAEKLHFRSKAEWLAALGRAGFAAAVEPCSRFPFADLLFTSRLASAALPKAA
jgi:SAM-dependent methyltransferase